MSEWALRSNYQQERYRRLQAEHSHCGHCGREMRTVVNRDRVYWQCPVWGSFFRWWLFQQPHDMDLVGDAEFLAGYDRATGKPL